MQIALETSFITRNLFIESRILERNRQIRSQNGKRLNVRRGEVIELRTFQIEDADDSSLVQHGDCEFGPGFRINHEIAWIDGYIRNENRLAQRRSGPYQVQAAIAALHAEPETDWREIACLFGVLAARQPSPVVELNRAVAVAFADGAERGLELVERIEGLEGYHLFHSARADLLRRLGRLDDAAEAYRAALELAHEPLERRFLERRLAEVADSPRV